MCSGPQRGCMDFITFIEGNRDALLAQWEALCRERVPAASKTEPLALRDHMPIIIGQIEQALAILRDAGDGRAAADSVVSRRASEEHGRHRASTEGYTVGQVLHEYTILREVMTKAACAAGGWEAEKTEAIARVIELGMTTAASEFAKSLDEVQQKLVGTLAHDIRTPLSTVQMALKVAREGEQMLDQSRELLEMAQRSVARAMGMLDGLLDSVVARAGDGFMLTFDDGDFAEEIAKACAEAKRTYASRVVGDCPTEPILGVFDAAALRRIFDNLVSNAVRYGDRQSPVRICLEDQGESVVLSVRNSGEPIDESKREEIFGFLSSTNEKPIDGSRNWGIGLAYVKLAAEGHDGSVAFESDAERGTTFYVEIPKRSRAPGKIRVRMLKEA